MQSLAQSRIEALIETIHESMGLNYRGERCKDLLKKLPSIAEKNGYSDVEKFVDWLLLEPLNEEQVKMMASHLTIGETYFFRDERLFHALETIILPELINERRIQNNLSLKIWSAGCCTGEEPYSLAMLLVELLPDWRNWSISITGTDINPTFLEHARKGEYKNWSFRATSDTLKEKYFKSVENGFSQLDTAIRYLVRFDWLNLANEKDLKKFEQIDFDIICCRNVCIYFSNKVARNLMSFFGTRLVEKGYLVIAPQEVFFTEINEYERKSLPGVILLRKSSARAKANNSHSAASLKNGKTVDEVGKNKSKFKPPSSSLKISPTQISDKAKGDISAEQASALDFLESAEKLYQRGDYKLALDCLDKVKKTELDSSPGQLVRELLLKVRCMSHLGEPEVSLELIDKYIEIDCLNSVAYFLKGSLLHEKGLQEEAIACMQKAIFLEPKFVMAEFFLGTLNRDLKYEKTASIHFRNVLSLLQELPETEVLPESNELSSAGLRSIVYSLIETDNNEQ